MVEVWDFLLLQGIVRRSEPFPRKGHLVETGDVDKCMGCVVAVSIDVLCIGLGDVSAGKEISRSDLLF